MTKWRSVDRERHFLLCGLIRNGEGTLRSEVDRLTSAFEPHGQVSWLVVESDSSDRTPLVLKDIELGMSRFVGISLGRLEPSIPNRVDRISYCRNVVLDHVVGDASFSRVTHVVVVDLDGVNCGITPCAVETCWTRDDWDVVCANQNAPYYDIYALRHSDWMPGDCRKQWEFLESFKKDKNGHLYAAVYSRMIEIDPSSEWIEVESAFGGLAIYRRNILDAGSGRRIRYSSRGVDGRVTCEHVEFHSEIRAAGGRIFINPGLINASYTEHSRVRQPYRRALRNLRNVICHPIRSVMR